jgi:hypothetical protein
MPYGPKFYKLRRLVRSGYNRPASDPRPELDYAVIQIETPAGGLGLPPVPIRPDVPPVGEPLFVIHHPRGTNIMNPGAVEARIRRYVVPLVLVGAAAGREPRVSTHRAADRLVLPPHAATMDDCGRLLELLLGAPPASPMTTALTIGVLEILSTAELDVTAVYTATGVDAGSPVDIDVVGLGRSLDK